MLPATRRQMTGACKQSECASAGSMKSGRMPIWKRCGIDSAVATLSPALKRITDQNNSFLSWKSDSPAPSSSSMIHKHDFEGWYLSIYSVFTFFRVFFCLFCFHFYAQAIDPRPLISWLASKHLSYVKCWTGCCVDPDSRAVISAHVIHEQSSALRGGGGVDAVSRLCHILKLQYIN